MCVVSPLQCSFVEYRQYKIVYRRYASLFFIVGLMAEGRPDNELSVLEFIHTLVETLDQYFENVVSCFSVLERKSPRF